MVVEFREGLIEQGYFERCFAAIAIQKSKKLREPFSLLVHLGLLFGDRDLKCGDFISKQLDLQLQFLDGDIRIRNLIVEDGDLVFDIQKAEKEVKEKEGVVDKDEGKLSSWFEDGLRGSRLRPPMRRK